MLQKFLVLISGIIFGLGLTISNMTNPDKVLSFLDVFGNWDPSLIFVMGGAILVFAPGFYLLKDKKKSLLGIAISLPKNSFQIDKKLILGTGLFGIGWGSVGFCPGPAISSIALLNPFSLIFIISLIAGFYLSKIIKL